MRLRMWQVDAFADATFRGNPAAVVPLQAWPEDRLMQAIAAENNLSETAFLVRGGDLGPPGGGAATAGGADRAGAPAAPRAAAPAPRAAPGAAGPAGTARWAIRWFTPLAEVDLCGHATLGSAHVVLEHLDPGAVAVAFVSRSGPLPVTRDGERLALDFPARPARRVADDPAVAAALGAAPLETWRATDLMCVLADEAAVRALRPDHARLLACDARGVIVTAPGRDCDFVSRFFAPRVGVPEDPVTGSAHCTLVPYWSARLGRDRLHARQVSARGGTLWCARRGARVSIAGRVAPYLEGAITVPDT